MAVLKINDDDDEMFVNNRWIVEREYNLTLNFWFILDSIQSWIRFQATQSEGPAVDRGKVWCQMIDVPYYRFSPQLSEDVALDNSDDRTLVNMLWETQCYLHQHHEKLAQLASLLLSGLLLWKSFVLYVVILPIQQGLLRNGFNRIRYACICNRG